MARYSVPQNSAFPYHITDRCPNRGHFPVNLELVWEILCDHLFLAHHKNGLRIHAFVLMPNHFHLMASVTDVPLGKVLCEFLTGTSKALNFEAKMINQRWGGRAFKCEIPSYHYYMNAYKYLYQNPVRAKLCEKAEAWPYSTLGSLLGQSKLIVPLEPDTLLMPEGSAFHDEPTLKWINEPIESEEYVDIKKALKKVTFKLPKQNEKPNRLETELI
jgi:putative transposase